MDESPPGEADKPHLPMVASEAVFESFVDEWRQGRVGVEEAKKTIGQFCQPTRFPLEQVRLDGTPVDNDSECNWIGKDAVISANLIIFYLFNAYKSRSGEVTTTKLTLNPTKTTNL